MLEDIRNFLPTPSPSLQARVPSRLTRPTLFETTDVAQKLTGYMFTDVKMPGRTKGDSRTKYDQLREKFENLDLWDTLTRDVVDTMLNPPAEYDPDYQEQINVAVLTCIKTLENRLTRMSG